MAFQRDALPRLNIPTSLNMQQPMQTLYSPALPTSIQQGFHPPLPMQTPMQPFFNPIAPGPARPGHRVGQGSVAHLAAAGIHPPNGFPMTPMGGGHFPRPSIQLNGPPSGHPFPGRNRRQLSIGGPPKALLGGPQRKVSPLPTAAAAASPSPVPQPKKKIAINFPKESFRDDNGKITGRQPWARDLVGAPPIPRPHSVHPVEIDTMEEYPPAQWRSTIPDTIEVFLPGRSAWDIMRQMAIEEKLEKLGVEPGRGSAPPHVYAPHTRAASISTPADPALLLFKLNKLQQSQHTSATHSLASSPQPLIGLSPSPNSNARYNNMRHGHSMSLAQPPVQPMFRGPSLSPFGCEAALGSERASPRISGPPHAEIFAPQGRAPVGLSSLAPPSGPASARSDSRPDFARGFGLDIPEEAEEEQLGPEEQEGADDAATEAELTDGEQRDEQEQGATSIHETVTGPSQHHSRHTSKLSAALSLRSFGVFNSDNFDEGAELAIDHDAIKQFATDKPDLDGVEEWTGSEDVYMGQQSSGDESIGEWSNPSDEERARQQRVDHRMRKRVLQEDAKPRRIPNFPRPPDDIMIARRDEDIISNPSDEDHQDRYLGVSDYYDRPPSHFSGSSRPLPTVPHSRLPSQHSAHDPTHAHSRQHSDFNSESHKPKPAGAPAPRLNPNAKPFVFGAPRAPSSSFTPEQLSVQSLPSHSRAPSFGKPLNVEAPEFKPGSFSFKFPTVNPVFPAPEVYSPPRDPPAHESSPFRTQGREKRRRQGSTSSIEEGDSFASFRFPPTNEPPRKEAPSPSPRPALRSGHSSLNPSAEPFTFAGFSAAANLPAIQPLGFGGSENDNTQLADYGDDTNGDFFSAPTTFKNKRAPIPLDFKHTVSNNTVPAGLFKALANNPEERTRRNVRSRLSSREVFEHLSRPSLDDLNMPAIAHKISRSRLVTDPGKGATPSDDVFESARHARRRSSLPDALHTPTGSEMSEESFIQPRREITTHGDLDRFEEMLDEKLAALRRDIRSGSSLNPDTEAMVSEVLSLFRAQLRESAAKSLEDSQMDARGELDFQLIRDLLAEGRAETIAELRRELASVAKGRAGDALPALDHYSSRTIEAVRETISELSARLESITRAAPARERDAIVDSIVASLSPLLGSLRPERVDYDFLTDKLTQAVKPHISQLIDLASDKRETAGLIVDRLIPLLAHLQQPAPTVDTDAISIQLVSAVTRAIAPIDAFEIKEQVSDLVVERLDARLANRDKAFSIDSLAERVAVGVASELSSLAGLTATLKTLEEGQADLSSSHSNIVGAITELAANVLSAIEALGKVQGAASSSQSKDATPDENVLHVKTVVDGLSEKQQTVLAQSSSIIDVQKEVLEKVSALPEAFSIATQVIQDAHAEFAISRDITKRELEDLRKSNTEYQVQVAKARGAHGQVRVEKEVLNEKLGIVEADRDRLRSQLKEIQDSTAAKAEESAALNARNTELQEALAKALARLQSSDVATQANQARIAELEKANQDLLFDKRSLKSKIDNLDVKAAYASRDKEMAEQTIANLRKEKAELVSHASQWENLRQTTEQITVIATLMQQSDDEELKELKRIRDRTKVLEGEHSALQKRFREQEGRISNSEKSAFTARQSLSQAQQRSSEWERRAKEYEGQLELTRTQLEQAEQTQAQLDADYQVIKMQFDEREADDRLSKDREAKLTSEVAALEARIRTMQSQLEKARPLTSTSTPTRAPQAPSRNGNGNGCTVPRPDSRASTAYDRSRSVTPNATSVYDSIHAPKPNKTNGVYGSIHAPAQPSRYPSHLSRATPATRQSFLRSNAASPTPSIVSVDENGWWS